MEEDVKKLLGISYKDLPNQVPIFPLDNILLLPFGKLPLNIFESRYINMTLDSLKKNRLIGIVQPKNDNGEFYKVGCLGKITSFIETPDSRIVLNLDGISRFDINDAQLSPKGYFYSNITCDEYIHDLDLIEPMIDREKLIHKYANFFKIKKYDLDLNVLEETSNLQLITTLTMLAPFSKIDNQAILEAKNLVDRLEVINSILDLNTFRVVGSSSKH
jgi:Lon protease-like protein